MLMYPDHGVASCNPDGLEHVLMSLTDVEFDEHYTGDFEVTHTIDCIAGCLQVSHCI